MPEWLNPEPGYYTRKYQGRMLEVVRNTDATDKRRYVARVDGVIVSQPCHNIGQCKTKAMKWVDNSSSRSLARAGPAHEEAAFPLNGHANCAVVPYVEPEPPVIPDGPEMMEFKIIGKIPSDRFAHAIASLKATVDMLRDEGALADCAIEPPPRVKL